MSDVVDMRRPQRLLVDRRDGDGVDLRADIAARRRIDALVAEIRAFPQARERIADAVVSLLRRHAPRVRRIRQHIHFRRVLQ